MNLADRIGLDLPRRYRFAAITVEGSTSAYMSLSCAAHFI